MLFFVTRNDTGRSAALVSVKWIGLSRSCLFSLLLPFIMFRFLFCRTEMGEGSTTKIPGCAKNDDRCTLLYKPQNTSLLMSESTLCTFI